jgi:predicted DCC family thiol-disulfide oxidoreductase YuxK
MGAELAVTAVGKPVLLFDDECGVCRRIARWVKKSAGGTTGETTIVVRPIGTDPEELRLLNSDLDIWDAYATIHVLMPDGSMKLGGEAVAETFRRLPNTTWFSSMFSVQVFGLRPFQTVLNGGYAVLAAVRPLLGCESCGTPSIWLRPLAWIIRWFRTAFRRTEHSKPLPHFTGLSSKNPQVG